MADDIHAAVVHDSSMYEHTCNLLVSAAVDHQDIITKGSTDVPLNVSSHGLRYSGASIRKYGIRNYFLYYPELLDVPDFDALCIYAPNYNLKCYICGDVASVLLKHIQTHPVFYWVNMEFWHICMHKLLVTFKQCLNRLQWLFNAISHVDLYQECGHLQMLNDVAATEHYTGSILNNIRHYTSTFNTMSVANLLLTNMGLKLYINECVKLSVTRF